LALTLIKVYGEVLINHTDMPGNMANGFITDKRLNIIEMYVID
jgi:hypothetical protein